MGKRKDLGGGQRLKRLEAPDLEHVRKLVNLAEQPPPRSARPQSIPEQPTGPATVPGSRR